MVAHEEAHLRERHDLVLEFFTVLHTATPRLLRTPPAERVGEDRRRAENHRSAGVVELEDHVVDGVEGHRFEHALTELKAARGAKQDVELTAADLAANSAGQSEIATDGVAAAEIEPMARQWSPPSMIGSRPPTSSA